MWEGQTDEGEIGFIYNELDEIVYKIDHNKDLSDIDQDKLLKVQKMMKASEHKIKEIPKFIIKK
ncbi:NH(3)-dependent NAD(+) synthetase [subsurface metagenome]